MISHISFLNRGKLRFKSNGWDLIKWKLKINHLKKMSNKKISVLIIDYTINK